MDKAYEALREAEWLKQCEEKRPAVVFWIHINSPCRFPSITSESWLVTDTINIGVPREELFSPLYYSS